tara:strand:+ start:37593 stop:38642 length:1050 start_codon:yes stop_codon:yes gene_type:complete
MKKITITPNITIQEAMKKMSDSGEKCLIIVNENNLVLGTLSDGDLRKAILNGLGSGDMIENIYQTKPTIVFKDKYNLEELKKIFIKHKYDLIPVVNSNKELVDVLFWENIIKDDSIIKKKNYDIPVAIMAGGQGKRMEPFTNVLPKPLVPVHDKPIIEHIIDSFTELGCNNFYITVNYKSKIMKAYFEELKPSYNINFVDEVAPLGTAGSLGYLKEIIKSPFFVTNCDILIKSNYGSLYNFHLKGNYDITLVASAKEYIIPYGTCELDSNGQLLRINEKPQYDFLINTGLYILNAEILELIPKNKFYHITHLIEEAKQKGKKIGVFPIHDDDWMDVGQWAEYKKTIGRL